VSNKQAKSSGTTPRHKLLAHESSLPISTAKKGTIVKVKKKTVQQESQAAVNDSFESPDA